jgi:hypothetical protein
VFGGRSAGALLHELWKETLMAYEGTQVAVPKSQDKIRQMLMRHKGGSVAFISDPPLEGFQAIVQIDGKSYSVKIMAKVREKRDLEQECRRIWRVLYHHIKSIFEASDSGVMEFREMMLPYIMTVDGRTVGEHIIPVLDKAIAGRPDRLLPAPGKTA